MNRRIEDISIEELKYRDGSVTEKAVAHLDNGQGLVLNKTRALQVSKLFGPYQEDAIRKLVNLFTIQGRMGAEIHVRKATAKQPDPEDFDPDLDDNPEQEERQATRSARRRSEYAEDDQNEVEDQESEDLDDQADDQGEADDQSEQDEEQPRQPVKRRQYTPPPKQAPARGPAPQVAPRQAAPSQQRTRR